MRLRQIRPSETVNHLPKEGHPRHTIYNTLNRMQFGGKINEKKKTGRPTSLDTCQKEPVQKIIQ